MSKILLETATDLRIPKHKKSIRNTEKLE
jgi:hypothetical protein